MTSDHGVDPEYLGRGMLAANGVTSVEELQDLVAQGKQLKTVECYGWTDGFQDRHYAKPKTNPSNSTIANSLDERTENPSLYDNFSGDVVKEGVGNYISKKAGQTGDYLKKAGEWAYDNPDKLAAGTLLVGRYTIGQSP